MCDGAFACVCVPKGINGGTWIKGVLPGMGMPGILPGNIIPLKLGWLWTFFSPAIGPIPILDAIVPSVLTTSRFTMAAAFGGGGGAGFGFVCATGAFGSTVDDAGVGVGVVPAPSAVVDVGTAGEAAFMDPPGFSSKRLARARGWASAFAFVSFVSALLLLLLLRDRLRREAR